MKKTLSVIVLAGVFAVASVGCKKDKKVDCSSLEQSVSDKANAYMTNQSQANCTAYKSSLQEYVNSTCSDLTQAEKDEFNEIISALTCQ